MFVWLLIRSSWTKIVSVFFDNVFGTFYIQLTKSSINQSGHLTKSFISVNRVLFYLWKHLTFAFLNIEIISDSLNTDKMYILIRREGRIRPNTSILKRACTVYNYQRGKVTLGLSWSFQYLARALREKIKHTLCWVYSLTVFTGTVGASQLLFLIYVAHFKIHLLFEFIRPDKNMFTLMCPIYFMNAWRISLILQQ